MLIKKTTATSFAALSALFAAPALAADTLTSALTKGTTTASVQYRFEDVETGAATASEASAHTVRLRLGYATGTFHGFGAMVEAESVQALGSKHYDSRALGQTANGYAVIADPDSDEINQAFLSYTGIAKTTVKWGRQRIKLDNDRFVGNVGWRQNEQTYDAVTVVNTSLPATTLTAGYITNVNRVFSDRAAARTAGPAGGNHKMGSTILNARYTGFKPGELSAYAYLLDYDSASAMLASTSDTYGVRFKGGALAGAVKLLYTAELATQSDGGDNPVSYRARYALLEGGVDFKTAVVKLGYEVLGGDRGARTKAGGALVAAGKSFSTPLATLHAFNGWADMFLATPSQGLRDVYVSLDGKAGGANLMLSYHAYRADKPTAVLSSKRLGSEWNISATKAFGKHYLVGAKLADYSAAGTPATTFGTGNVDTRKAWLWGEVKF
ncbi:alginate export family protein [Massilia glaciei]|uniref:Alginate export domain-containing protein n=1 Tax=Massilia glaciei TaxID=1524097 RepID=A0A2U2HNA5_9BURK|nr:alginate export family protein [Massilia glaciei]PWF48987.1 hypothetical protein C7C56_008855 [Massilia glaciei]